MRLGIIACGRDSGLGIQSWEACRHLDPDRVLVIDRGEDRHWPQHFDRFEPWPHLIAPWSATHELHEATVRDFLAGLDCVWTAETFYDDRLPFWAKEQGVTPVCQANPEFFRPVMHDMPAVWWTATPWRLEHLPPGTRLVPMPVATDRFPPHEPSDHARFLHVAGWPTVGDRNGTRIVVDALKLMDEVDFTIRAQHRAPRDVPGWVKVENGGSEGYWDLYRDADVLVLPRRFGGLSLVAQEAMAAGLVVFMTDVAPNRAWPGPKLTVTEYELTDTPAGRIFAASVVPAHLEKVIYYAANDPHPLGYFRAHTAEWVAENSWDALLPLWRDELDRAVS